MNMAKQRKGNTVETVWKLAQPIAESLGLKLWDVRFVKEGATWILRIFIDKDGGVNIDDCVDMTHAIDKPLDEADPIDQAYCLEVSSPGIERELTRPEHFEQMTGEAVVLHLIRPNENGEREVAGILNGLTEAGVSITDEDGTEHTYARKELSAVTLIDMFDDEDMEYLDEEAEEAVEEWEE
jgi:ribosome maturation factor RimP